jgi:hypothetical protein
MSIRSGSRLLSLGLIASLLSGATDVYAQAAPVSVPASASGAYPFSWRQHELTRPAAPVVTPASTPGGPPSDAIVLFNGRDLSAFVGGRGNGPPTAPTWKVENGYAEIVPRGGSIRTKESFGDAQIHLEWAAPTETGIGQNHSNSGVILMGQYEIQILDSYHFTDTYVDGSAGAIYGQYPPLANPVLPTGQFNVEDIIFRRPRFRSDGSLADPARATIILNGVVVQDNEVIFAPTAPEPPYQYVPHADAAPFTLQDHGEALRFRNIWARRLPDRPEPGAGYVPEAAALELAQLDRFVGTFYIAPPPAPATPRPVAQGVAPAGPPTGFGPPGAQSPAYTITRQGDQLMVRTAQGHVLRAIARSPTELWLPGLARDLTFTFDSAGKATEVLTTGEGTPMRAVPRP